jgi:two-component system chemotaxis response regulator CheB
VAREGAVAAGRTIRVLVAEDSFFARSVLVKILESDPQIKVVGVARNGQEAVDLVRSLHPDVVTMDIRMPVMDGFQATQLIMAENPTPILVISASVGSEI